MFCAHLVILQGFVELLVFSFGLVFLKSLDLGLLLQESLLDVHHVLVALEHLSEEVVRPSNWHFRLNQESHAKHHIVTHIVIKADLSLDLILYSQLLWHHNSSLVSYD